MCVCGAGGGGGAYLGLPVFDLVAPLYSYTLHVNFCQIVLVSLHIRHN